MRFENVNGIQHIILDESDKVSITTESELKKCLLILNVKMID